MRDTKISEIHGSALEMLGRDFSKKDKVLSVAIKKGNLEFHEEYRSDMYFLCKFHMGCFGVNKKGALPPKFKISVNDCEYNMELSVDEEHFSLIFRENKLPNDYISLIVT